MKKDIKEIIKREKAGYWLPDTVYWVLRTLTDEELSEYSQLKSQEGAPDD